MAAAESARAGVGLVELQLTQAWRDTVYSHVDAAQVLSVSLVAPLILSLPPIILGLPCRARSPLSPLLSFHCHLCFFSSIVTTASLLPNFSSLHCRLSLHPHALSPRSAPPACEIRSTHTTHSAPTRPPLGPHSASLLRAYPPLLCPPSLGAGAGSHGANVLRGQEVVWVQGDAVRKWQVCPASLHTGSPFTA